MREKQKNKENYLKLFVKTRNFNREASAVVHFVARSVSLLHCKNWNVTCILP